MKGRRTTLAWLSACAASCACSVYDDTLRSFQGVTPGALGAGGDIAGATSGSSGSMSKGGEPSFGGQGGAAGSNAGNAGGPAASAGRAGGGVGGGGASDGGAGGMGSNAEAGAAGATEPPSCEALPIPLKGSWMASASHSSLSAGEVYSPPEYVMDLSSKRWSTGKVQAGDEWLQIDFRATAAVRELTMTLAPDDAEDYPRGYEIVISDEPLDRDGKVVASGAGALGQTLVVTLPELAAGRFVLVKQTGKDPVAWWSVAELSARCY